MNSEAGGQTFTLRPVGYVREVEGMPTLQILEPYRPALKELRQFSHVYVFWWFDQNDNEEARANLQDDLPYAPGTVAGVFASRSERRPNPLAMTICLILDVDEAAGTVVVPWIDAFNGTPILDMKPYVPVSDRIRDVSVAEWFQDWPEWMEDGAAFFAETGIFDE